MMSSKLPASDNVESATDAVKTIEDHCRELESLLLYILQEGMTKEAYRRIGECLRDNENNA